MSAREPTLERWKAIEAARTCRGACLLVVVAMVVAASPGVARGDFTPQRPYLFMTPADVTKAQYNVTHYSWAQTLYSEAKSLSDAHPTGSRSTSNSITPVGKYMMAHAVCYLISGEQKYADRATSWLKAYAVPNTRPDYFSSGTKLGGIYGIFPIVYDMVYNGMSAADRTTVANWLGGSQWYTQLSYNGLNHNTGTAAACGKILVAYALGHSAKIAEAETAFMAMMNGLADNYFWDASTQAFKNYAFVVEHIMPAAIASHNAVMRGYTNVDLLLTPNNQGLSFYEGNWKTLGHVTTPLGQVPYQTMWRGRVFTLQKGSAVTQHVHALADNENWPDKDLWAWYVRQNPTRKLAGDYWTDLDLYPGLTHGREVSYTPQPKNDCIDRSRRGFAVLRSGNPAGPMTENTLHAYLMHGYYGTVEGLNLKLYGKGRKLTQERMDYPDDIWGERGSGGIFVNDPRPGQVTPTSRSTDCGANRLLWDVDSSHVKAMAYDYLGNGGTTAGTHIRTVAVTGDYFWDVYRCNAGGPRTYTFLCDGVGDTASASVPTDTSFSGNFWVNWPNHMRYWAIAETTSKITLGTYTNVAEKTTLVSGAANQYPSENIKQLRIYRYNSTGPQYFIGVFEPIGYGGATKIYSVQRFNTSDTANVTGVKVDAQSYRDYLYYMQNVADRTLTSGSESVRGNGRFGYIRYNKSTRALVVEGSVTQFTVDAPNATSLTVNDQSASFTQNGDYVTWTGSTTPMVATPTISPSGGTFESSVLVSISCATTGATVRYTTDGSTPTTGSTLYSAPFTLTSSATVKAKAWKSGMTESAVASASFTITQPPSPTVVVTPSGVGFAMPQGDASEATPASANVAVTASDSSTPSGVAATPAASWVTATVNGTTVTLSINSAAESLSSGTYSTTVEVTATGLDPADIAVDLLVAAAPTDLPGRVEAENYKEGGEGVGYHDTTAGNAGGAYRDDDVDIEATGDTAGLYNVGWTQPGEWLAFDVDVASTGDYDITFRVASNATGTKTVRLEIDGTTKATCNYTYDDGWQVWRNVTVADVNLTAGVHEMRIVWDTANLNVNYVDVLSAANAPPVADAGSNQSVDDNDQSGDETVTLDGSGSSDSDGTITSYVWKEGATQIATGQTAQATLSIGQHTITLLVTDDDGDTDSDTVSITVNATANQPPVADAGEAQEVDDSDDSGSETVTLDGSGSSDVDGTITSYVWKEGANQIATGQTAQVSLAVGDHTIELVVTDDDTATASDTVFITVNEYVNLPPVADAGPLQYVTDEDDSGSETVTLDGSGSSDPDGTITSYVWKEGANQIATGQTAQVSLSVGVHAITLVVTDDDSATGSHGTQVTVYAAGSQNGEPVQLNLSSAFNFDTICGPKEWQECRDEGDDLKVVFGSFAQGNAWYIVQQSYQMAADSTGDSLAYSLPGDWYHPRNLTGTQGLPEDGVLTGGDSRVYHVAAISGNSTLSGDWTEVADPSTHNLKPNVVYVGTRTNLSELNIAEVEIELPAGQKGRYVDVNFVLTAANETDRARNMRIVALYGESGADEEVLYSFSTADGGSGPKMPENNGGNDFEIVYTMSKAYNTTSGTNGAPVDYTISLYEFASPLALDETKDLWGFRIEDLDPDLASNARGLAVFAATATPVAANTPPVADAGDDDELTDEDGDGWVAVTLDGTGSSDSDGTIVSYVWSVGGVDVAAGETAEVELYLGVRVVTLTVMDDDGDTASDTVTFTINEAAVAEEVQLDLTDGFNVDAVCGPKEYQECRDEAGDLKETFGDIESGNGWFVMGQGEMLATDSTGDSWAYSIPGDWYHPRNLTGTQGLPEDGILTGADDRVYHVASLTGNDTLSGDWTEVADPSTHTLKSNCVFVGCRHNINDFQIEEVEIELPAGQKGKYVDVNFLLAAANMADRARNMRIVALYGATGADEEVLYSFSTADGGSGPIMLDSSYTGFAAVYTMSKSYNNDSGNNGAPVDRTSRLWEFDAPLSLNEEKDLWGFRIEDTNPTLNYNARGVAVLAATATRDGVPATTAKINFQPYGTGIPEDYEPDYGYTYGDRGNGLTYGWSFDVSDKTRDRNHASSPDQSYDTLAHMDYWSWGQEAYWEIAVPNGQYQVRMVAGDPGYINSYYKIDAEGVLVLEGQPTIPYYWVEGTATVTVSDGKLTVTCATGSDNNRMCFIEITPLE